MLEFILHQITERQGFPRQLGAIKLLPLMREFMKSTTRQLGFIYEIQVWLRM